MPIIKRPQPSLMANLFYHLVQYEMWSKKKSFLMLSLKLFWFFFALFFPNELLPPFFSFFFLPKLCSSNSHQLPYSHLTRVT